MAGLLEIRVSSPFNELLEKIKTILNNSGTPCKPDCTKGERSWESGWAEFMS